MSSSIRDILKQNKVVPVVVIENEKQAISIADALLEGGITTMEITLRTDAALPSIKLIKQERPQISVGAGTVTTIEKLNSCIKENVDYIVSPGTSPELLKAFIECRTPILPGVSTISEIMALSEKGINTLKFFPANINGGTKALSAFKSVMPEIKFCPTGGVSLDNMQEYLNLDNVISVGGSWLTPKEVIKEENWKQITLLAKQALEKTR